MRNLQARIDELKKTNEEASQYIQKLDIEKQNVVSNILVRNGRILELEELLIEEAAPVSS
mgnify:CR=1 FL=1